MLRPMGLDVDGVARSYIDLLTFPLGAGGRDTPSRLVWVAAHLGYSVVGILRRGRDAMPIPETWIREVQVVTVAEEGWSRDRGADLRVAFGKRAARAAATGAADFIVPAPNDTAALRSAAENEVPVAYPYSQLLKERAARRSSLIRSWCNIHGYCEKHACPEVLVSGAEDSYLMRDPRDLACALHACLGVPRKDALDWLTSTPRAILDRARERGDG